MWHTKNTWSHGKRTKMLRTLVLILKYKGQGDSLFTESNITYTGTHGTSCRKRSGTTSQNMKETLGHLYLSQLLPSGFLFSWYSAALILVTCASHKGLHHQQQETWKLSSPIKAPRKEGKPTYLASTVEEGTVLEICGRTCCVSPANEKQRAMAEGGEIRSPVTHFLQLGPASYRFHSILKQCHHLAPKDWLYTFYIQFTT